MSNISTEQLRLFVERLERLLEEKKGISDDVRDTYAEAKSSGYDAPTIREIIKLRAMEKNKREEKQALLETYQLALNL